MLKQTVVSGWVGMRPLCIVKHVDSISVAIRLELLRRLISENDVACRDECQFYVVPAASLVIAAEAGSGVAGDVGGVCAGTCVPAGVHDGKSTVTMYPL